MKVWTLIVCAAAVTGCALPVKTKLADGSDGYLLNCSGIARGWGDCMQSAGRVCGSSGYEVVNKSEGRGVIGSATGSNAGAYSSNSAFVTSTHNREMLIRCKDAH
jgi:hypothetical protein